jgi:hypothetical protein
VAKFDELYEELGEGRLTSPHIDQIYDQLIGRPSLYTHQSTVDLNLILFTV